MIISNKYNILDKIGEGSYGNVYIGEHIYLKKKVAIKLNKETNNILLKNEAKIYKYLENTNGVPNMLMYGFDSNYNYIILEKLDRGLERNTTKKICNIGIEMIQIIEAIHLKGIIHRDIKPENFMYKNNKLYLIDYGFATMYLDNNLIHKKETKIHSIIGSVNYISLNVHDLILPSRRDDIESIIYVLLFLYNKLNYENSLEIEIKNVKKNLILKCNNANDVILQILLKILLYVRKLNYSDTPNYNYIYKLLKD